MNGPVARILMSVFYQLVQREVETGKIGFKREVLISQCSVQGQHKYRIMMLIYGLGEIGKGWGVLLKGEDNKIWGCWGL